MVKNKAGFKMAPALKRAIHNSALSQTAMGFPVGLGQSEVSRYMTRPFGSRVRAKIEQLGASLGIPVDQCVRSVR